jgi:hypothetical protein
MDVVVRLGSVMLVIGNNKIYAQIEKKSCHGSAFFYHSQFSGSHICTMFHMLICLLLQVGVKSSYSMVNTRLSYWLGQAVSHRLLTRMPGFAPGSFHVGFVVDRVGQVFLRVVQFSAVRVFENRVLRRIFGGSCTVRNFTICTHPQISLDKSSQVKANEVGSGQGPVAGCCECGDEPSGSCAAELVS